MPYITSEEVKAKRNALKKEFPAFKMSITREHHSTIRVAILSAPFDLIAGAKRDSNSEQDNGYRQVNPFYIGENYTGETKDALQKIQAIINDTNKIISEDGDYGSIPKFYTSIQIGEWNKPFQVSNK